jgi:hypothetical protein
MAPLSPSFSHRPSSAVRAQSPPQLRAADQSQSRAQHELQRQRVANAQAAAANAADAANAAAAHLSSLLSAAAPPAAAIEVEGAANATVRVDAHGDSHAAAPAEELNSMDSAATLDAASAPVDRGISVDIEFRPSSTTAEGNAVTREPHTPPHARFDHAALDQSASFHAAMTNSRPLSTSSSAATLSLAPPLYLRDEPLPPLVSGQHFYEAYAGAAAFKSPLVSKGTKVLSGGGGSGGNERAHCLKRMTGHTPTASDYAYQWPHCTVPAPLLRQYQALNQHRWLELQAQRRRQEQEWADFQAQKAAAGLAASAGVAPHQPALPSISTPVSAIGFADPFPVSAHSAANTSHYGTPVQPYSHSTIADIDPLAPPSMQLVYAFDATASLHVHQQPSVVRASSAIPAAAVSPSHVAHHDRHRTASPQPALHRAASRRSLGSGAAFSFTEPALDATTAALNLASAAAPLCAKPPPPVLNPDIVAPDSKVDRHRAPDPDKYRIEHQRHWI